jgi:hypothetical protein
MIMAALVAGGIAYAGARVYYRQRQRRTPVWLIEDGRYIETSATIVETPDLVKLERRVNLNFNLAILSLSLAAAGVLLYEPLLLLSIPFNIYDAITIFEDTWTVILEQGRIGAVLISSSLVALTLATRMYLLASLLEWLYFLNQKLVLLLLRSELGPIIAQQRQPEPVNVV